MVLSEEERQREHRAKSGGDGDEDRARGFGREAEGAQRAVDHEEGKDVQTRLEEAGAGAAFAPARPISPAAITAAEIATRRSPTGTWSGANASRAPSASATGAKVRQNVNVRPRTT